MCKMVKFIFVGAIALLGIFMAACPQYAVKQEERENEDSLASMRKRGIVLVAAAVICGIALAVVQTNI